MLRLFQRTVARNRTIYNNNVKKNVIPSPHSPSSSIIINNYYTSNNNNASYEKKYHNKKMKFKNIDQDLQIILKKLKGQMLHAKTIGFHHPRKNENLEFKSELPSKFTNLLNLLDKLSD